MLRKLLNRVRLLPTWLRRPSLSVIICSIDDRRFATVAANYAQRLGDWPYELIRIDDARSLAEGYNRGIARSSGELLIFSHDDIEILTPDFRDRLLGHMQSFDLIGVAGTSRLGNGRWLSAGQPDIHGQVVHRTIEGKGYTLYVFGPGSEAARGGIQALDGLFIAARRSLAESLRFDGQSFDGFHLYDIEFSYRAHLEGARVGVCRDILLYHHSLGEVTDEWQHYMRIFQDKFGDRLATGPAGTGSLYLQKQVSTKAEALTLFQQHLRQQSIGAHQH
jgi:hypothetical protein